MTKGRKTFGRVREQRSEDYWIPLDRINNKYHGTENGLFNSVDNFLFVLQGLVNFCRNL